LAMKVFSLVRTLETDAEWDSRLLTKMSVLRKRRPTGLRRRAIC
jgi:hypothetical protein